MQQPLFTIAFYNTENLFDTNDDEETLDRNFTPNGNRKWTKKRYENKIGKLSMAISKIGVEETSYPPSIIGLAEVENAKVVQDLINKEYLGRENYDFVHYDSWDERGIDVALIYNTKVFNVEHSEPLRPPMIYNGDGRDMTRDVLYVRGKLNDSLMHIFVVHMPSRREENVNSPKRQAIAEHLNQKIRNIQENESNPHIIVLGDFNADPTAPSLKKYLNGDSRKPLADEKGFHNPMELLENDGHFTTKHRKDSLLYDQILFSAAFFVNHARPSVVTTHVFNPYFLQEWDQKYKHSPFRTFVGSKYLGGYSDHFPIYSILKF